MIWQFGPTPGTVHLAAVCDTPAEWDTVTQLGTVLFDGQPALVVREQSDRASLWLRFRLEEPFRMPPTVIHFEDVQVANRIAETGWYAFDGGLYRARLRGPGELVLDRVYAADPTVTFEGRQLPDQVGVAA